jgi:hypothetical protein
VEVMSLITWSRWDKGTRLQVPSLVGCGINTADRVDDDAWLNKEPILKRNYLHEVIGERINYLNNNSPNGNGTAVLPPVDFAGLGSNGNGSSKNGNAPAKVANPLLAPYLGAGATEAQIAYLLEMSQYAVYCELIAPRMRTSISYRHAAALIEWVKAGASANAWNCPVAASSQTEMVKWVTTVRRSLGFGDWTFKEKVNNRIERIHTVGNSAAIPLEKGEKFWVWLCAILSSFGLHLFWAWCGNCRGHNSCLRRRHR